MSEVHRYDVVVMLSEAGGRISYDPHGPEIVMAEHFDRVTAERDAALEELAALEGVEHARYVYFGSWKRTEQERDALQQRLTAADERADLLEGLVRDAQKAFNYDPEGSCYNPGIAFVKPWSVRAIAALKPAEGGGDE